MRYYLVNFSVFILILMTNKAFSNEMTLNELFFDDSRPYHIKILDALPDSAIIQIGPDDAKNTVIESNILKEFQKIRKQIPLLGTCKGLCTLP